MMLRRGSLLFMALVGLLLTGSLVGAVLMGPPLTGGHPPRAATDESNDDPGRVPHRYDMPMNDTTLFAAEAARRLPGWRVVQIDPGNGIVRAEARTLLLTEDITVNVIAREDASIVNIRSRSRTGTVDFGANVRNIGTLQAAMDERLPQTTE